MHETPLDRIQIRNLRLRCIIGVYPRERTEPQEVRINITLHLDLRRPGMTDEIADTVDYKALKKRIAEQVTASQFQLIEALAASIAGTCLEDQRVRRVDVSVDKPGALTLAESVAVEITRRQS
jgi:dihydroneopterin aldolase/D-erythro-7,8-dihydroneopterin triphosphate epimerase